MKSIQTKSLTGSVFSIVVAALVVLYLSSCARKISFQSSSIVPAARGDVKVKKDNNNNYNIQISLSDLAEPKRLQPSRSTYVVWMETANNTTKNIGQINSSTGFLSGKLKASFETVSSTKPTKIFLTAEDDASIQYPGEQVVLSTNDF
jgi:hypothetical protein